MSFLDNLPSRTGYPRHGPEQARLAEASVETFAASPGGLEWRTDKVNDSVVRLGIVQGEYHWHQHNDLDEFLYVVEGHLLIDLEGRTVDLGPKQGIVIPKGVQHRPRAPERVVVLMVEGEGIVPTGD